MLFILHGHDFAAVPAKFRNENYHVVCPMDRFGVQRGGSWWLGEDGDFFWLRVMPRIVESIRSRGGTDLFFWGSSMGGWGALLHGYLNHAKAVYANVPQTVLLDSSYSNEGGMKQYFSKIFGKDGGLSDFNDLKKIILDNRCRYFLCFNQLEKNNYFAEQGLIFLSHLNSIGAQTYFELRPLDSHGKNHGISETLGLFDKYC
ncbi:hypothetical protein L541_3501 [Bordetella hinzii CA90 BAL1384]|nr:hypothetical protein L541_3501 [Bordetella hinzii CA90 BAL1384]